MFDHVRTDTTSDSRPLAPAPWPVFAGVVALASFLLFAASSRATSDWGAVFGCLGILAGAAYVLDRSGRAEAAKRPHPLYSDRLPSEPSKLKIALVLLVLAGLVMFATLTATSTSFGSSFPYFLAAGFLFLVLPQLMARRVIRRHDRAGSKP